MISSALVTDRDTQPNNFNDVLHLMRNNPIVNSVVTQGEMRGWSQEQIMATCIIVLGEVLDKTMMEFKNAMQRSETPFRPV